MVPARGLRKVGAGESSLPGYCILVLGARGRPDPIHSSVLRQVVPLLTGRAAERLGDLGPIEFRGPVTETTLD